jgi:site-specific recombinase XerD
MKKILSRWISEAIRGRVVKEYLEDLVANNRRPKTIEAYQYELSRFFGYFTKRIETLKRHDINEYLAEMSRRPKMTRATMRRTLSVMREFLRFLRRDYDLLEDSKYTDPSLLGRKTRRSRKVPRRPTTPKDMLSMRRNYKRNTDARRMRFQRDLLLLRVLFYTGVRVEELGEFKMEHILNPMRGYPKQRYLFVRGKGGDERHTIIDEESVRLLAEYCQTAIIGEDEPVFLIKPPAIRKRIRAISKGLVKTPKGYLTPHDFRRGFACRAYYQITGKDILRVQEWLGHQNLETTEIYVKGCTRVAEEFVSTIPSAF